MLDCFAKAKLDPGDAELRQSRHHPGDQCADPAQGRQAALVTTEGFRDILEIARGNRPDPFDLHYRRDEPLIPRELRFEVKERTGAKGEIVTPLDRAALTALAGELKRLRIEAVAVFFMNSYANPAHEEAAAQALRALLPGRLRDLLHRADAGMVRIRAHLDGRRQCLCGAAGHPLYRGGSRPTCRARASPARCS